jgi:hypothetical protein
MIRRLLAKIKNNFRAQRRKPFTEKLIEIGDCFCFVCSTTTILGGIAGIPASATATLPEFFYLDSNMINDSTALRTVEGSVGTALNGSAVSGAVEIISCPFVYCLGKPRRVPNLVPNFIRNGITTSPIAPVNLPPIHAMAP